MTLQHSDTKLYLSSHSKHRFGQPIQGQLEVSARTLKGDSEKWTAQEGIYISSSSIFSANASGRDDHDEEL